MNNHVSIRLFTTFYHNIATLTFMFFGLFLGPQIKFGLTFLGPGLKSQPVYNSLPKCPPSCYIIVMSILFVSVNCAVGQLKIPSKLLKH